MNVSDTHSSDSTQKLSWAALRGLETISRGFLVPTQGGIRSQRLYLQWLLDHIWGTWTLSVRYKSVNSMQLTLQSLAARSGEGDVALAHHFEHPVLGALGVPFSRLRYMKQQAFEATGPRGNTFTQAIWGSIS